MLSADSAREEAPIASRPQTILFLPASNILFHVGRCMRLARELSARGHRIVFGGTPRYLRDPAVTAGLDFEFEPLPDFGADEAMEILREVQAVPSRELVDAMVEAEVELLGRLRPDLVVSDFRPTLSISSRIRETPVAALLLSHWMQQHVDLTLPALKTDRASVLLTGILGARLTARLTPRFLRLVSWYKTGPFRAAGRARGLESKPHLWDLLEGDLNLLADTEAWCPTRRLPPNYRRIGPIIWEPEMPLLGGVLELDRERTVVYVNFGSTGHPDLFRRAFAELDDPDWQVVLTTCGQVDARDFDVPANFVVEKFLPVEKMLEIADLVIYHGGSGTAYQLIRAGVPGITVATHWDQEYQGWAGERLGLGPFLTLPEVRKQPGLLGDTARRVLAELPEHRARAKALQADLLKYDGPATGADCVEQFLAARRGGPSRLQPDLEKPPAGAPTQGAPSPARGGSRAPSS